MTCEFRKVWKNSDTASQRVGSGFPATAPLLNFELAVAAFEEHGIEYEAHTYPEGHGFRDPDNRIALYRRVEEFFRRRLGVCR